MNANVTASVRNRGRAVPLKSASSGQETARAQEHSGTPAWRSNDYLAPRRGQLVSAGCSAGRVVSSALGWHPQGFGELLHSPRPGDTHRATNPAAAGAYDPPTRDQRGAPTCRCAAGNAGLRKPPEQILGLARSATRPAVPVPFHWRRFASSRMPLYASLQHHGRIETRRRTRLGSPARHPR